MYETISALRVHMCECDDAPAVIIGPHGPSTCIQRAWIPQTICEQIWVMYEFKSKEERESWEATLPNEISRWLDRDLIGSAISYGWNVRDANGFCK